MQLFTLENQHLKITLSDLGASWLSCVVKFPHEEREVLVTTTPDRWQEQSAYFGATIGRYANRIAQGRYSLNNLTFQLAQNNGPNNLHGGEKGADKCIWQVVEQGPQAVKFAKIFANGEEGFGGEVQATVKYGLEGNQVRLAFEAVSDQDTPLCLTNHAYFNLSGEQDIKNHRLQIQAQRYLPVAADGIPSGDLKAVEGTGFDFRQPKAIGQDLLKDEDQRLVKGYDHAFELAKNTTDGPACCLAVEDLRLELNTSLPALQVYTGNWLDGQPDLTGGQYGDYAGVALEPECFPDSPNHPEWWDLGGILRAGETYQQHISYRFLKP
ncbi:galactose mutarotase [Pasteurellaceae bacterium RH1A]|nr:galactose mutarotase [Pasteurellaceae bacterium RH1A]